MSFSGNVEKKSHEGGLLVAFEGRAPRLGAMIRVVGGKSLGRVNTVIGAVDRALIHIHPLDSEVDAASAVGSPVEIAPREDRRGGYERRDRRDSGGYQRNDRRGRDGGRGHQSGGQRYERRDDRSGRDQGNRGGDWTCPKCKNSNFAFRTECNRCDAKKPEGAGDRSDGGGGYRGDSGHGRKDRGGQRGDRGGYRSDRGGRDGGRSEKRGNDRGGDWHCPKCNNSNFAFRTECNRCDAKKPEGGGGRSHGGDRRGGGSRSDYRGKDRAAGDRRGGDSRGGNRGGDSRGNYRGDDRRGDGPRGGDRGGFQPRSDRSGPSRGRAPGSQNRPRRSGFRGSNKGKDKR